MILADVNVLVYAFRAASARHDDYRIWLETATRGDRPFAFSTLVVSSFIRLVTNPRIFERPDSVDDALGFAEAVRHQPSVRPLAPGDRHWGIFDRLCRTVGARGNVVPDAYLAALAIESGSELISADRGLSRFPGLSWRHPLDP